MAATKTKFENNSTYTVRARGYEAAAIKAFEQAGYSLDGTLVFSHVRRGGSNISAKTWNDKPVYHKFPDTHVSTLVREDTHADIARATVRRNDDKSYSVELETIAKHAA